MKKEYLIQITSTHSNGTVSVSWMGKGGKATTNRKYAEYLWGWSKPTYAKKYSNTLLSIYPNRYDIIEKNAICF